jgi:hypothetical protein
MADCKLCNFEFKHPLVIIVYPCIKCIHYTRFLLLSYVGSQINVVDPSVFSTEGNFHLDIFHISGVSQSFPILTSLRNPGRGRLPTQNVFRMFCFTGCDAMPRSRCRLHSSERFELNSAQFTVGRVYGSIIQQVPSAGCGKRSQ